MDKIDFTSDDMDVNLELNKIRYELAFPSHFDGVNCVRCYKALSQERLSVFAYRCFECQSDFEKPLVRIYEFKDILPRT